MERITDGIANPHESLANGVKRLMKLQAETKRQLGASQTSAEISQQPVDLATALGVAALTDHSVANGTNGYNVASLVRELEFVD